MANIGLRVPRSGIASTMEAARGIAEDDRLSRSSSGPASPWAAPAAAWPTTARIWRSLPKSGLDASLIHQVMLEESVLGWKEFELEVMRDHKDNVVIICSIENIDPMGVHTGDTITVAPAQTLTDREYQVMRDASIAIMREIGVDTGGSNVQFADQSPKTARWWSSK